MNWVLQSQASFWKPGFVLFATTWPQFSQSHSRDAFWSQTKKSQSKSVWVMNYSVLHCLKDAWAATVQNKEPRAPMQPGGKWHQIKLLTQTIPTKRGDPAYWAEESFWFCSANVKLMCPPTMPVMLWKQQFPVWIWQSKQTCWLHLSAHQSNLVSCTAISDCAAHVTQSIRAWPMHKYWTENCSQKMSQELFG